MLNTVKWFFRFNFWQFLIFVPLFSFSFPSGKLVIFYCLLSSTLLPFLIGLVFLTPKTVLFSSSIDDMLFIFHSYKKAKRRSTCHVVIRRADDKTPSLLQ